MVVLQWNMGIFKVGEDPVAEKRRVALLAKLLGRYQPDLVALQEAPVQATDQILLNAGYATVSTAKRRLVTGWKNTSWGSQIDQPIRYERASAVVLTMTTPTGNGRRVLVCNVHLPSLATHGSYDRTVENLKLLAEELKDYRRDAANDEVAEIIIGDFNLEPHAPALRDEYVLNGNRSLQYVTDRESKRPKGDRLRSFYNPSWRLYGSEGSPHGSHYYAGEPGGPWYVFDQAFFSGDLASEPVKVKLIEKIGRKSLLTTKVFQPDKNVGSDHLPIVWTVKLKV